MSASKSSSPSCVLPATRINASSRTPIWRNNARTSSARSSVRRAAVKFHVSQHLNDLRTTAHVAQTLRLVFVFTTNAGKRREDGPEQPAKFLVARIRTFRQPRIGDERGDFQIRGPPKKIGPDFRFQQNHRLRIDGSQRPANEFSPVQRIINLGNPAGKIPAIPFHPRARGAGDNDFGIGNARFEHLNQPDAKPDFTNADGVEPDHLPVRERLLDGRIVNGKPLAKTRGPISRAAAAARNNTATTARKRTKIKCCKASAMRFPESVQFLNSKNFGGLNGRNCFKSAARFQARKKSNQTVTSTGRRKGSENLTTNSPNDGIRTPFCSAMALTMKFGPLPM